MTTTRVVRKNLAGEEDLLLGSGTEDQTRNGNNYTMTKIGLTKHVATIAERDALDTDKFVYCTVLGYPYRWNGSAWVDDGFSTVLPTTAALIAATTLIPGQYVTTLGFITLGDMLGGSYLIAAPQVVDELWNHTLANGNVALYQNNITERIKVLDSVTGIVTDSTLLAGTVVNCRAYYSGWAAKVIPPVAATYDIVTKAQHDSLRGKSVVDELGDHTLDNGNVALLRQGDHINVKHYGAVGDDTTDDHTSLQGAAAASILGGKEFFMPSGQYKTSSVVSFNLSAMTTEAEPRPNIRGEGRGTTDLHLTGTGSALAVLGGTPGTAGSHGWLKISDLTLRGENPVIAGSRGLEIDNLAYIQVDNVAITLFELGTQGTDILSSQFNKIDTRFCDKGATHHYVNMSRPNAISYVDCVFGACALFGLDVVEPGVFNMRGGSVEGCGVAVTGFGVRITDGGTESALGMNIDGVYFEGNKGLADVRIIQTTREAVTTIKGCSFARIDSTDFTTYNISFAPSNDSTLCLLGNGFTELGTYVANVARPYIDTSGASGFWSITDIGNRYNDQNTAPRNNVLADTSGIAQVRILFDGLGATINAKNVTAAVTVHAAGDYTVTYAQPMRLLSNQVHVTPVDGGTGPYCIASVHSQTANSCRVQIRDSATQALVQTEGIMVTVHGDMTQGW